MSRSISDLLEGYKQFKQKYHQQDDSIMQQLSEKGQKPQIMVVACSDSRVDPALLLQCDPGELFVVRNVANIIPRYDNDQHQHGTSAALEFAICYLNVKHLVILGHSQCGGIHALLNQDTLHQNEFITNWTSLSNIPCDQHDTDTAAKMSLQQSHDNCFSFPWIKSRVEQQQLTIHRWFLELKTAQIWAYDDSSEDYKKLEESF